MTAIPIPDQNELRGRFPDIQSLEFVALGGFKAVFKATDCAGVVEALKAIYIPSAMDGFVQEQIDQMVARAQREIDALAACSSGCIVKLGSRTPARMQLGGRDYLVYSEEFLPGRSLRDTMSRRDMTGHDTLREILLFLLDVIAEMIRIKHLHRDIKPENIMVTGLPARPYVILDMGIAYKMHGTQLTQGGPPGTTLYMAPELFSPSYKDVMDFRCDLYAAGLTVYEIAAGQNPFAPRREAAHQTQWRIMNEIPPPLESLRPDLPPKFCRVIDRCFRKNPALRYPTIQMVKKDLTEALS